MAISVRSFAKINIGLLIGPRRSDGFHALHTIYQTISLHDMIRVEIGRGTGIEIYCKDPRVPQDESNTCWRVAERVMKASRQRGRVTIAIQKQVPVQGGLGAASSNAVATMLGIERALGVELAPEERLRIASEVGSDLPLFLVGGTVLGTGRGEQVWPLRDVSPLDVVVATPAVGVSTPAAFAAWDEQFGEEGQVGSLTGMRLSDRIATFSQAAFVWLAGSSPRHLLGRENPGPTTAGVPVPKGGESCSYGENGGRVGTPLLDLVRAGIENDFERVVFPMHPELREVKRMLEREGARYASLSGSGSTLYGLFETGDQAKAAAANLNNAGVAAVAASTLTRQQYWDQVFDF